MAAQFRRLCLTGAAATLLTAPALVHAQASAGQGPLLVEQVHDGIIVAPDYKITSVNHESSQLAGAYAGVVHDESLLIGGAAYWLVKGRNDDSLAYGGLLIGWSTPSTRRIHFGARALAGVGRATIGLDDVVAVTMSNPNRALRFGGRGLQQIRVRDDFVVFEPQASVTTRLADHIGVNVGGGYRFACFSDAAGDRLSGPSGSLALQFTW